MRKKKSRSLGEVSGPSLLKPELKQEPTQRDTDPWSCQGGTSEAHLTGPKETDSFLSIIPSRGHPVSSCGPHPRSPGAPPTGNTPEWVAMPSSRRRYFLLSLYFFLLFVIWSFPGGVSGREPACQCRRLGRCELDPWVRKIPWRRKWQPTPVFTPREAHGQCSLGGYRPWGPKSRTQLSDWAHTHALSFCDPAALH